jgi:hypothetical protein
MSTEMQPITWGMSPDELESWASGASDGQVKTPDEIQRQEVLCRAYQQKLDDEALAERSLALDETRQAQLAKSRSDAAQLEWIHFHSGTTVDRFGVFHRWGFVPSLAGGNAIAARAQQQWSAAGNTQPLTELTYELIDRAAISLYEEGALAGWVEDGVHSIYARFERPGGHEVVLSEQAKQEKRETIARIQEQRAETMPLEKLRELADKQLAEQSAGQPDHDGSMWGDRSQRGEHSNMPLNPGWGRIQFGGTFEPSEE